MREKRNFPRGLESHIKGVRGNPRRTQLTELHKCAIPDSTLTQLQLAILSYAKDNNSVEKTMSQSRLEKLKEKMAQLDAQIKGVEARERQQARKNDTRRKIIAGALALHHAEKNPEDSFSKKLFRLLNEYVTKPYERKLFGLPLTDEATQNPANDAGSQKANLKDEFKAER